MTNNDKGANGHREPVENNRPGVLGDGTEEQNLNQKGHPEARIKKDEVEEAFGKKGSDKPNG